MTYNEEYELLNLTRENNILLKMIYKLIDKDESFYIKKNGGKLTILKELRNAY